MKRQLICPDRIRRIQGSFAFIEHRFLPDGFFAELSHGELLLYFFLVPVSDRRGISRYSYDRICNLLRFSVEDYIESRNSLIDKDLIAFDGHRFQVLSLPEKPVFEKVNILKTEKDMEKHDPATVGSLILRSLRGTHD